MNFKLALFILFSLATLNIRAQIDSSNHFKEHHHSEYELGFSSGIVYDFGESEFAYGLHLHFVKTISKSDKIGIGLGYERIFDDHKHNAVSVIFLFRPIEHFSLNLAPGVSWLATESNSERFSLHIESLYEWELGNLHLGPLVGFATNMEDFHASLGIHIAIGF